MGNACKTPGKPLTKNEPVSEDGPEFDPDAHVGGEVHIIVACIGYDKPKNDGVNPLNAREAGDQIMKLVELAGITDVVKLYDTEAHTDALIANIQSMAERCNEGDTMIFYFNGHGVQDADVDGDEDDGQDEFFFTVQPDGSIDWDHLLSDDLYAETVCKALGGKGVKYVTVADCCHSGTICDFHKPCWGTDNAVCISACTPAEVSFGGATGGMATNAMIQAINEMGADPYSVGQLFDKTLEVYERDYAPAVFESIGRKMTMNFSTTPAHGPNSIAWPLIPEHEAPTRDVKISAA